MTPALELRAVTHSYGAVRAADGVSLSAAPGEFFAMLGPSGSGKTTCLRLIAGFETPDAGEVWLAGREVTREPPYSRDVNTVFQDYALFPHLTVIENVCYGPRMRGVSRVEQRRHALEMLQLVRLPEFADRKPAQLSGGQRQRVALARALVNRPRVLLLDEPLGALDLKLREEMQIELKNLQRTLGVTFVFVTHDQGEALSMADRIAVFNQGRIEQLATPRELYTRPRTRFVARFVGGANVIDGVHAERLLGESGAHALRAEHVRLMQVEERPPPDAVVSNGVVVDVQYHGAMSRRQVQIDDGPILAALGPDADARRFDVGARVQAAFSRRDLCALEDA